MVLDGEESAATAAHLEEHERAGNPVENDP